MGHEFMGEEPSLEAVREQPLLKTGEKVKEDGAYYCANCYEAERPPMVNLNKGQMIPVCAECGPGSRWAKV